jgi:hypothetical protein
MYLKKKNSIPIDIREGPPYDVDKDQFYSFHFFLVFFFSIFFFSFFNGINGDYGEGNTQFKGTPFSLNGW